MTVYPNGLATPPRVTSAFGPRRDPISGAASFHTGVDSIGHPGGWNRSPFAGVVIFAQYNGGAGNEVRVRNADGDVARLKHHRAFSVSVGDSIPEGGITGPTGTTGYSTGVHCHCEIWPGGRNYTEPYGWIAARLGGGGGGGSVPPKRGGNMTTLYHTLYGAETIGPEVLAIAAEQGWVIDPKANLFALCGDSPGTPANVLFTAGQTLANQLATVHNAGGSIPLSPGTFNNWVGRLYGGAVETTAKLEADLSDVTLGLDPALLAAAQVTATEATKQTGLLERLVKDENA